MGMSVGEWSGSFSRKDVMRQFALGAAEGPAEHGSARRWHKLRAQVLSEELWCACGAPVTEAGLVIRSGPAERWNLIGQCDDCNRVQLSHVDAPQG